MDKEKASIGQYLKDQSLINHIHIYPVLESTNITAKQFAKDKTDFAVIIANEQTGGKGRMGRKFFSPPETGIYMSIMLRPKYVNSHLATYITTSSCVGVCRAIESVTGVHTGIKWVNDIFAGGRKICGILGEASVDCVHGGIEYIIIGIGVNLSTKDFPNEIADTAGSVLTFESDCKFRLIGEIINNIVPIFYSPEFEYIEEYKSRSIVLGHQVTVIKGLETFSATATDIDSNGALVVKLSDGSIQVLSSGEISIRGDFSESVC